jgi:hypothetical protein
MPHTTPPDTPLLLYTPIQKKKKMRGFKNPRKLGPIPHKMVASWGA